jgi:hypothetical protein
MCPCESEPRVCLEGLLAQPYQERRTLQEGLGSIIIAAAIKSPSPRLMVATCRDLSSKPSKLLVSETHAN